MRVSRQSLWVRDELAFLPAVKLLDFAAKESELKADRNPFAKVVLAHLKARQTQGDPANRSVWKLRLVRGLYEQGFGAKDVRELFRVIDWLLALPRALEIRFRDDLELIQQEKKMPYVTSIERIGRREGIHALLKLRFGDDGLKLMPEIEDIHEEDTLREIINSISTVQTPEDVRRIWLPTGP